jgi:hypothetical protein
MENDNYLSDRDFESFLESIEVKNWKGIPIKSKGFFSVGNGWLGIIKSLIEDLIKLGWNGEITQVKSKFGGLRFYINQGSPELRNRISQAEEKSFLVCSECGDSGEQIKITGWIHTLCEVHGKEKTNRITNLNP